VSFSRSFHQALPQPTRPHWPESPPNPDLPRPYWNGQSGTWAVTVSPKQRSQWPYWPLGGEGQLVAGLRPFSLVRSLETVRSIDRPSMGLLRQPTTSKIMEDGRWAGPTVRARIRAHSQKTNLRLRCQSHIQLPYQHIPACWRSSCPDAHRPPTGRLGHRNDPPTARSDASCMASTHQGDAGSPASGPCGHLASKHARRHGA
jgi:hypothetical protein